MTVIDLAQLNESCNVSLQNVIIFRLTVTCHSHELCSSGLQILFTEKTLSP